MVYFVITGFGNFAGVKDNPTEHIAKNIEEFIHARKKSLPDESMIYSSTVLKVSAEAVGQWLTETAEDVNKALQDAAEVVWVSMRQGLALQDMFTFLGVIRTHMHAPHGTGGIMQVHFLCV